MVKRGLILGLDTSNYTTSLALLDTDGGLVANLKLPLPVRSGERGLRQSDALFHHTVNLPALARDLRKYTDGSRIVAVGVSERPRNAEGSYMPCFLAGVSCAELIAGALGVPVYRFSHQCGHIMAALYSSSRHNDMPSELGAFHISGGTTELLRVRPTADAFFAELVGGSADLNAGQVIDRVGVAMGISFPAGPMLEKYALSNKKPLPRKKISARGMEINLSGLENMALSLYRESREVALVGAFVFDYIGRAIAYLSEQYETAYGKMPIVYAGGVMCNSIIRGILSERFEAIFAEPKLSADNAVGIAALALKKYKSEGL